MDSLKFVALDLACQYNSDEVMAHLESKGLIVLGCCVGRDPGNPEQRITEYYFELPVDSHQPSQERV